MFHQGTKRVSARSFPVAVAAVISAAVVLIPTATPARTPVAYPTVRLAAAVLPFEPDLLDAVGTPVQPLAPDVIDAIMLAPPAAALPSIGDALIGFYLTVEQWAQYGADLLQWAVRWLPWVGVLAPQVGFFYDLGESIVAGVVFNTAYLLDGSIGFGEALSNMGSATAAAFDTFVDAQINWFRGLLPPMPPIGALAASPVEVSDAAAGLDPGVLTDFGALLDPDALADLMADPGAMLLDLLG